MKKNTIIRRFSLLFATLVLGLGFTSGLKGHKEVAKVEAAPITKDTMLYFLPDFWASDDARFVAYFYGNEQTPEWIDLELVPTLTNVYQGKPTKTYSNVIFGRMNPDILDNKWNGDEPTNIEPMWNQTVDLTYDGINNLFTITNWDDGKGKSEGVWSQFYIEDYTPVVITPTTRGINENKVRIWLNRNGHYAVTGYQYVLKVGEVRYAPSGYQGAILEPEENEIHFAYYDLPISVLTGKEVGFTILDSLDRRLVEVPATLYESTDNSKLWTVNIHEGVWSIEKGALELGEGSVIFNSFFAYVLEGYLTCLDSNINGYLAFPMIDANFLPKDGEAWLINADLDLAFLDDYADEANYAAGPREEVTNAYDKYAMMANLYNSNSAGRGGEQLAINSINNTTTFIIIFLAILVGFGYVYFIHPRRKNA